VRLIRLLSTTFSLSLRRGLAHRVNFAFDVVQSGIGIATVLATTMAIFHQTQLLAGWSRSQMLVLIGIYAIVTGVRSAFIDPSLTKLVSSIRDGTLDEALLQPAPSWFTTSCREHAPLALGQSLLGIVILAVGVWGLPAPPGLLSVAVAIVLTACAITISWAFSLAVACLGFWAGRFELGPLTASLWEVGRFPADVYGRPMRTILTYLVPLAGMITLPATALTRTGPLLALVSGLGLAVCFVVLALVLFRHGLRRYTGATS
jgi:ABC-2 type transport system permease protein